MPLPVQLAGRLAVKQATRVGFLMAAGHLCIMLIMVRDFSVSFCFIEWLLTLLIILHYRRYVLIIFNQTILLMRLMDDQFANDHKNIMELFGRVNHVQRRDLKVQSVREVHALVRRVVRNLHQFDKFRVLAILELNLQNDLKVLLARRHGLLKIGQVFAHYLQLSGFEILVADGDAGNQNLVVVIKMAFGFAELIVQHREHFEAHAARYVHSLL